MADVNHDEPTREWEHTQVEHRDELGGATAEMFATSKALQVRRWESRSEPFRGFGSPPGKF